MVMCICVHITGSLNSGGTTAMLDGLLDALKEILQNGQYSYCNGFCDTSTANVGCCSGYWKVWVVTCIINPSSDNLEVINASVHVLF